MNQINPSSCELITINPKYDLKINNFIVNKEKI